MNTPAAEPSASAATGVRLPVALWRVMKPRLQDSIGDVEKYSSQQAELARKNGSRLSLRLLDGTVKEEVTVNWDGVVVDEWYQEYGIRAEVYRQPRFSTEDIESWGYYQGFWSPTWRNWFGRARRWCVLAYANGRTEAQAR